MFTYPASITYDTTSRLYIGTCRDFAFIRSSGQSIEKVQEHITEMVVTGIAGLIHMQQPVPEGSPLDEYETEIRIPVLVAMKVALHNTLLESGTRKSRLARELGIHAPQMSRLLDVNHLSRIDTLERALRLSGKKVSVCVRPGKSPTYR